MKVAVIGATGFVGGYLVEALLDAGHRPSVLVREGSEAKLRRPSECRVTHGDLSSDTARTYGAIRGSLETLDDPYTLFVEPQRREREQEELRGSFGGIGAWVERTPDGLIILTPMDDRPAARAGVQSGDELIAVAPHASGVRSVSRWLLGLYLSCRISFYSRARAEPVVREV